MEATFNPSVAISNLFDLPAAVKTPPRKQPKVTAKDCLFYSHRLDLQIKESSNCFGLHQPIQIRYFSEEKIFKTANENKLNRHSHLVFDPFDLTAETAGSFLFLAKICGYLVFVDTVPYAPLVPHKTAVLQFMNFFQIIPDFTVFAPHGLKDRSLENSKIRLSNKFENKKHELKDCHPRSKIKRIIEAELLVIEKEIETIDKLIALKQIR
jgi:hypothetical protein